MRALARSGRRVARWASAACVAGLFALATPVQAQAPWLFGDESAAHPEGVGSLVFNPAAQAARYPSEFALSLRHPPSGADVYRGAMVWSGVSISMFGAKDERLGYGFGFSGGEGRGRWGLASSWIPERGGRVADHRLGLLMRPRPWLSIGGVADHLGRPRLAGGRLERLYTVGIGLRPLAFDRRRAHDLGTRFTLTADAAMFEDQNGEEARLRFGAEIEPVLGLPLRASWFPGDRSFQLGLSLLGLKAGYHGRAAYDRDRRLLGATHSLSFHEAEDRTVFAGRVARRVAVVRAGGPLADESYSGFSIYGGESGVAVGPLHAQLERALEDPWTRGVLLDVRGVSSMAQIEELRPRIARLRARGKPVVAYLETGGGRASFYLATACDRIVASPEAFFAGLGLRAERRYYRKLLHDWGVRIDRTSAGKYKSAYRNFSVDSTPPADAEAIEHNLDVRQELFVSAVTADRGMSRERLLGLLDGRRWKPTELYSAGLIDSVGYRDDALAIAGTLAGLGKKPRTVRLHEPLARREWALPTRIAVVYASGGIESGRSGNDLLLGTVMGSETMSRQIERAFARRDVEAVVLRIESPGGSSVGSDLIHHTLVRVRGDRRKPLIVSMGSAAASGGYHIALPGEWVFANRHTATGSIGVVFVKPSLERWYATHDVRQDVFERGRYMRGLSLAEDWDREIQASADSANRREYREFVELVARSRNLTYEQAEAAAQGRVWLGEDARARKLVDAIGGLEDAVAEARRRVKIPAGEKLQILEFRRPRPGLVDRLVGSFVRETIERDFRMPSPGEAMEWDEELATE